MSIKGLLLKGTSLILPRVYPNVLHQLIRIHLWKDFVLQIVPAFDATKPVKELDIVPYSGYHPASSQSKRPTICHL